MAQIRMDKNVLATVLASLAAFAVYVSFLTGLSSFLILAATAAVFGLVYLLLSFLFKDAFLLYLVNYYKK